MLSKKKMLLVLACATFVSKGEIQTENLIPADSFQKSSFAWEEKSRHFFWRTTPEGFSLTGSGMILETDGKRKFKMAQCTLDIWNECADFYRLKFSYAAPQNSSLIVSYINPLKAVKKESYLIPSSKGMTKTHEVRLNPPAETFQIQLTFLINPPGGKLQVENLVLNAVEQNSGTGKPIFLDGLEVDTVYYAASDPVSEVYNRDSAKLLRSTLHAAGGKLLKLRKYNGKNLKNAILIEEASPKNLKIKPGGYSLEIEKGTARISGKRPGGTSLAVLGLWEKLGIIYLNQNYFSAPETLRTGKCSLILNPRIPARIPPYNRFIAPERLGYLGKREWVRENHPARECHALTKYFPYKNTMTNHPEWLALQKDGKRKYMWGHFCLANDSFVKEAKRRVLESLANEKEATYFYLASGDGGNMHCLCEQCKKQGNPGENNVKFINKIADAVAEKYPEKTLLTLAYSDYRFAPANVKLRKNVTVLYCTYFPSWRNHFAFRHPANREGLAELENWEKSCPENMGSFVYSANGAEYYNVWPAFYANMEQYKHFAKTGYRMIDFSCGYSPRFSSGEYPGTHNFTDLGIYMCPRISINPDLDLEKEIDHFMVLYYGPAAKAMRKYFNLIHADVRKRNFEQAVDTIVRGFITKELAAKAYACFREAERLTANSPVFAERVGLEKIYLLWSDLTDNNRANGRIDHSELKEYAEKLAEFCRLNKVNGLGEIWGKPTHKWLWETAVLKIGQKCPFYNDPVIVQLMKEPFAALQNSIPRVQEKKEYGIFIPASGVFGGYKSNSNWLRAKTVDAVQLRRASSGYGFAQALLILEGKPQKDVIMRIEGIDNEKKTDAFMEISVNGKVVFKGKNPWKKEKWSDADFLLPADVLQKGENTVTLKNITPDTEKDEFIGDQFRTKRNYFWGWFMFTGIKLILPKDGGTDKK